jgi:uroporphyrin-III C-methyltransferase
VTVYLVGAGPGDPGLLTVRGADLLRRADVVVHDRLAAPELLDLAPAHAVRFNVGKAPGGVGPSQDEVNALLVREARRHGHVVRLKAGDPFLLGRGGEEALALRAAGVPFEIVPGVTSAIAAPAYAGIPVTQRNVSGAVTIVTGHGGVDDPAVDWAALARVGGTIVVLMGTAHLAAIADRLVASGLSPDTPVAAIRWGSRPDQEVSRATLASAGALALKPPTAIVIGAVAALDLAWFDLGYGPPADRTGRGPEPPRSADQ